jgi:hypothetical protein
MVEQVHSYSKFPSPLASIRYKIHSVPDPCIQYRVSAEFDIQESQFVCWL